MSSPVAAVPPYRPPWLGLLLRIGLLVAAPHDFQVNAASNLFEAVSRNDVATMVTLVENGVASIKQRHPLGNMTVLHWSAMHGSVDVIRFLVQNWGFPLTVVDSVRNRLGPTLDAESRAGGPLTPAVSERCAHGGRIVRPAAGPAGPDTRVPCGLHPGAPEHRGR